MKIEFPPYCRLMMATHSSVCEWVHYPANAIGVHVIVYVDDGIVAQPPVEPEDAPAALPGGHVEYGESTAGLSQSSLNEIYQCSLRISLLRHTMMQRTSS